MPTHASVVAGTSGHHRLGVERAATDARRADQVRLATEAYMLYTASSK